MAGKRLLDAAKIFNAGRSVGKQHVALRQQQWEVYSKTSSLAKAVKTQTDRFTVTAGAAFELARRFNETGPSWPQEPSNRSEEQVPDAHGVTQGSEEKLARAGATRIGQESYRNVQSGAAAEPNAQNESSAVQFRDDGTLSSLRRRELQRQAEAQIPAGSANAQQSSERTIGQDTFSERTDAISPELSSLPRAKIPKYPEDAQESDSHVPDSGINPEVFYTTGKNAEAIEEELPASASPDGAFSSPRVSRMGGKMGPNARNPYAGRQKLQPKPLPEMLAVEERRKHDKEKNMNFSPAATTASVDSIADEGDAETQKLAELIANEAEVRDISNSCSVV